MLLRLFSQVLREWVNDPVLRPILDVEIDNVTDIYQMSRLREEHQMLFGGFNQVFEGVKAVGYLRGNLVEFRFGVVTAALGNRNQQ